MISNFNKQLLNKMNSTASRVQLGELVDKASGSHQIVAAGKHTTVGGAAAEDITVAGLLSTDVVIATLQAVGGTPRTILTALPAAGEIVVTFSGDPAADHVVSYLVLRAV